jgi:ankyrin repeat protein
MAAINGHADVVKVLLTEGPEASRAHANADDSFALRLAARNGHADLVKVLLTEGPQQFRAHVNANDAEAVRLAAANGHTEIGRLLCEHQRLQNFKLGRLWKQFIKETKRF